MSIRIEHLGKLIDDMSIPGERRVDGVAPAHGNATQLSRDRFLVLNSTLRFRGVDDNCSITWQLRRDSYTGPIIKEGIFAKSIDDWYPLGPKYRCVRQFGHPVVFGRPKGATVNGKPALHANVFVIKWRVTARVFVPEGGYIMWLSEPPEVRPRTQDVQWLQFRLSDDENDLEVIQSTTPMRQIGYEQGPDVCKHTGLWINQTYVQPVPLNDAADEWAAVNHLARRVPDTEEIGRYAPLESYVAAARYRFNPDKGCYEWADVGPLIGPGLFEGNISPHDGDWLIAARQLSGEPGVAWGRVNDPFTQTPQMTVPTDVASTSAPLSVYKCPDGVTRLCTGDREASPHGSNRDPIYLWDIDPDNDFKAVARHQIYSPRDDGNTIPHEHEPLADMVKLLMHTGGSVQTLIHRVRTCAMMVKEADYSSRILPMTDGDFNGTAIYHAAVHYDESYPPTWTFE